MKAIIEIPDDMIRSAGSAIAINNPKLIDLSITAMERLVKMDALTMRFETTDYKDTIESQMALMCVTQVMDDIANEQV